ncbi:MAG TPA: hypothetical protein EYP28_02785 [Methanophagales archaeon]|nr:hypothetical protein [Methanophagales archaeon]
MEKKIAIARVMVIVMAAIMLLSVLPISIAANGDFFGRIAFSSNMDGNNEIYLLDGTNVTRLTNNIASDINPEWHPNGNKIAFSSDRDGDFEIYVMDANGTNVTQLTYNTDGVEEGSQCWSPDGSKIAFCSNRDSNSEIYVMDADGTNVTRLTYNTTQERTPRWSPDGSKIAFCSNRDIFWNIYVMNADGTNQEQLTSNNKNNLPGEWSPDGSKLLFLSDRDGDDLDIYQMYADGTNVTQLTNNTEYHDFSPAWALGGEKIVFVSGRFKGDFEIYMMDADGTNITQMTTNFADVSDPVWAPPISNNKWTGTESIMVVKPDGSTQNVSLTDLPKYNFLDKGKDADDPNDDINYDAVKVTDLLACADLSEEDLRGKLFNFVGNDNFASLILHRTVGDLPTYEDLKGAYLHSRYRSKQEIYTITVWWTDPHWEQPGAERLTMSSSYRIAFLDNGGKIEVIDPSTMRYWQGDQTLTVVNNKTGTITHTETVNLSNIETETVIINETPREAVRLVRVITNGGVTHVWGSRVDIRPASGPGLSDTVGYDNLPRWTHSDIFPDGYIYLDGSELKLWFRDDTKAPWRIDQDLNGGTIEILPR